VSGLGNDGLVPNSCQFIIHNLPYLYIARDNNNVIEHIESDKVNGYKWLALRLVRCIPIGQGAWCIFKLRLDGPKIWDGRLG
jgi:hypothetical protein